MSFELTSGSIKRMLMEEDGSGAVLQMLGVKNMSKCGCRGNAHYRLYISDGINSYPLCRLSKPLNNLVHSNELVKYTVFRVDKYFLNEISQKRYIIVFVELTILAHGIDLGVKIGNPIILYPSAPNPNGNDTSDESAAANINNDVIHGMPPEITPGCINRMLNGEKVLGAVVQILACNRIPGKLGYMLHISDTVNAYRHVLLGPKLNSMAVKGELENFTIIKIEKCNYGHIQPNLKVIIILHLTILTRGTVVGEQIGDPSHI